MAPLHFPESITTSPCVGGFGGAGATHIILSPTGSPGHRSWLPKQQMVGTFPRERPWQWSPGGQGVSIVPEQREAEG